MNHLKTHQTNLMVPWDPIDAPLDHWMTIPKFWPKPIPRLFFRYQIFRNRYRDFFSDTKFSETETETFFRDQIFPKPILFFRDQISQNRNQDFFPRPNFSETKNKTFFPRPNFSKPKPRLFFPKPNFPKPKPSKIWQKFRNREVSKPKCQSLVLSCSQDDIK